MLRGWACLGLELNHCIPYCTAKLAGLDVPPRALRVLRALRGWACFGRELNYRIPYYMAKLEGLGLLWARIKLDAPRRALKALRGWACLGRELNSCMPYFTACLGRELNSCMPYFTAKLAGVDVPRRALRALRARRGWACLGREVNQCIPYYTAKLAGVDVPLRALKALRARRDWACFGRELGPGRVGEGVHSAKGWGVEGRRGEVLRRAGGRSGTGEAGVLSNSKPAIKATLRNTTSGHRPRRGRRIIQPFLSFPPAAAGRSSDVSCVETRCLDGHGEHSS